MSQQYRSRPLGSDVALSEAYDTALLDLDGVVYAAWARDRPRRRVAGHRP